MSYPLQPAVAEQPKHWSHAAVPFSTRWLFPYYEEFNPILRIRMVWNCWRAAHEVLGYKFIGWTRIGKQLWFQSRVRPSQLVLLSGRNRHNRSSLGLQGHHSQQKEPEQLDHEVNKPKTSSLSTDWNCDLFCYKVQLNWPSFQFIFCCCFWCLQMKPKSILSPLPKCS